MVVSLCTSLRRQQVLQTWIYIVQRILLLTTDSNEEDGQTYLKALTETRDSNALRSLPLTWGKLAGRILSL